MFAALQSKLSHWKHPSVDPTPEALEGFRKAQRLAYDCTTAVGEKLTPGVTEIEAARLLATYLKEAGVPIWLHRPLAWFGDRSRFDGMRGFRHFLPSKRTLKEGEPFILDVSPSVNGYVADVGHSMVLGENTAFLKARDTLKRFREEIPKLFLELPDLKSIWKVVDNLANQWGYDNCHQHYPFGALGHRLFRLHKWPIPTFHPPISSLSWFPIETQWAFLSRNIVPEILSRHHEGSKLGLWAIEPHLGTQGFGFKFEEILVVEEKRAYWLDDDVPHAK